MLLVSAFRISCAQTGITVPGPKTPVTPAWQEIVVLRGDDSADEYQNVARGPAL